MNIDTLNRFVAAQRKVQLTKRSPLDAQAKTLLAVSFSKIQDRQFTKFEYFPNEILLELFRYMNPFDIFYSFDNLNRRFNSLINIIQMHIDLTTISKSTFDFYCQIIIPRVYYNIYSLKLSNTGMVGGEIKLFFRQFLLKQFENLRSLTLIQPNVCMLSTIIPQIPSLKYLLYLTINFKSGCLTHDEKYIGEMIDELEESCNSIKYLKFKTPKFNNFIKFIRRLPKLISLTIETDDMQDIIEQKWKYFTSQSSLTYLNLQFETIGFEYVEMLLKDYPPYLKHLSFSSNEIEYTNSFRWQNILEPIQYLTKFDLNIKASHDDDNLMSINNIIEGFKQEFWIKRKWFIVCDYLFDEITVYTIPVYSNKLRTFLYGFQTSTTVSSNVYDNVNYLCVSLTNSSIFVNTRQYSNVNSLEIQIDETFNSHLLNIIDDFNKMINLTYLKQLTISGYLDTELVRNLLLCSINIKCLTLLTYGDSQMINLLENNRLCSLINITIDQLLLSTNYYILHDRIEQFLTSFSNIRILQIGFESVAQFKRVYSRLLTELKKLIKLNIHIETDAFDEDFIVDWLNENSMEKKIFHTEYDADLLCIWFFGD